MTVIADVSARQTVESIVTQVNAGTYSGYVGKEDVQRNGAGQTKTPSRV